LNKNPKVFQMEMGVIFVVFIFAMIALNPYAIPVLRIIAGLVAVAAVAVVYAIRKIFKKRG